LKLFGVNFLKKELITLLNHFPIGLRFHRY
jgi:hypothetical protein